MPLSLDQDTVGGVFVNSYGAVRALWVAYCNCSHEEDLFEQERSPFTARAHSVRLHMSGRWAVRKNWLPLTVREVSSGAA